MHTVDIVNGTGQYSFPFKPNTISATAVINENTSEFEYVNHLDTQYSSENHGKRHKFTETEKASLWRVILAQRVQYKAALLVASGQIVGINNAIKHIEEQTK